MHHLDPTQLLKGPCLKGCGNLASYSETNHETEEHQATCPKCGEYPASREEMDKANIDY
jgi:hypothetical protein